MNPTLLDNWKNASLTSLNGRLKALSTERMIAESKLRNIIDEVKVISYYIGLKEGQQKTVEASGST